MMRGYLLNRLSDRRWRLLAVLLVVVGQLGIVSAALTLARDETSAISHTEGSGTDLHHGHNEATCVACTALSLQGTPRGLVEHSIVRLASEQVGTRLTADPGVRFLFSSPSRAPPGFF
jgi:hypothetical protein